MTRPVWSNRFHWCALAAGFIAEAEGRIDDSRYVQDLAYELFEEGAYRDRTAFGSLDEAGTAALESTDHDQDESNE